MTQEQAPGPNPAETVPPLRLPEPAAASGRPPPVPPSEHALPPTGSAAAVPTQPDSSAARPPPLPPGATTAAAPPGWEDIFEPGETLIWQGQPVGGADWSELGTPRSRSGFIPLAVGCIWIAFALVVVEPFWAKFVMAAFGIPIVRSGYALSLDRHVADARGAQTTWYTVSSRALYIATVRKGRPELERFSLDQLPMEPRLIDGSPGHVWFAEADTGTRQKSSSGSQSQRHRSFRQLREPVGFRRLENPREVYGMIVKARAELGAKRPTRTLEDL